MKNIADYVYNVHRTRIFRSISVYVFDVARKADLRNGVFPSTDQVPSVYSVITIGYTLPFQDRKRYRNAISS